MSYLGSKGQAGVPQIIIGNMPPHSVYVEAFLGTGKIMREKLPAARNIGIEIDGDTARAFPFDDYCPKIEQLFYKPDFRVVIDDAITTLPKLTLPDDALIYCDPPYLLSTRTSRHRYKHEMTPAQHSALLTLLKELKCFVMISGYPSKLYSDALRGWRCVSYRTRTRGRTVTECLWCNFPEPQELHDWRFAGRNFRERLTLKRRAARLQSKLDALAPRHRGFVLDMIAQRYFQRGQPATNAGKGAAR